MRADPNAETPHQSRRTTPPKGSESVAIAEWVRLWVADSTLRPKSKERYLVSLAQLVRFGVTRLEHLTPPNVKRFLAQRRANGIAPSTLNVQLAGVVTFAKFLKGFGKFTRAQVDEFRDLVYKEEPLPPPRWLSVEEFLHVYKTAGSIHPTFSFLVNMAINTGLRSDSELLKAMGTGFEVLDTPEACYRVGPRTKTKKGRAVPLAPAFAAEVKAMGYPRPGPVFPAVGNRATTPYLHYKTLQGWMAELREKAGMPGLRCMDFRHTFASWHILFGNVSIALVAKWLGNTVAVCERHYSGLLNTGDARAAGGFSRLADARPVDSSRVFALKALDYFRPEVIARTEPAEPSEPLPPVPAGFNFFAMTKDHLTTLAKEQAPTVIFDPNAPTPDKTDTNSIARPA